MRYDYLFEYVQKYKAKTIMEIGTWNGVNSTQMIQTAQNIHNSEEVVYYGFDLWDDMDEDTFKHEVSKWPPSYRKVEEKLNSTGAAIHLYKGNTLQTLPAFINNNSDINIDLIFMDGGHSFDTIQSDWDSIRKIMKEHTVLLMDDYLVYPDDTEPSWGCNRTVKSIDRSIWNVNILPRDDFINGKSFHIVEVTKRKREIDDV